MTNRLVRRWGAHALGTFGLLLVLLVGKLAPHATARQHTYAGRVSGWAARRALDAIAAIGWVVDRLPPPMPRTTRAAKLTGTRIKAKPA